MNVGNALTCGLFVFSRKKKAPRTISRDDNSELAAQEITMLIEVLWKDDGRQEMEGEEGC